MTVVVCPGSCAGALAFKRAAGLAASDDSIVVGETSTFPYAAPADMSGLVRVFHKFDRGLFAAALPRSLNDRLQSFLRQVYPSATEAATTFQTTLQNGNPVIHPAVTSPTPPCSSGQEATSASTRSARSDQLPSVPAAATVASCTLIWGSYGTSSQR